MLPGGFSMPDLDAEQLGKLINDLFKTEIEEITKRYELSENMLFLKSLRRLRAVRKSKSGLAATENPPQSKILRRCDPEATKQDRKR